MTKRFISYLRVSTTAQGQSGLGLEAQRESVQRYVGDGEILAEHCDVLSGKRTDRPELAKALEHARAARATLVVAKLDRVGRKASHVLGILDDADVEVRFADTPHASSLELGVLAVVAEQEGRAISERTRAALKAAKARGTVLGNPNGAAALRRYEAKHGHGAAVAGIKAAADSFAQRLRFAVQAAIESGCGSANAIAAYLNDAGFPTRRGARWTHKQVTRVLERLEIDLAAKLPGDACSQTAA